MAVPIMPINGAINALVGYNGNGADSYDSANPSTGNAENGSYWGSNPATPTYLADAHNGNVAVNTATFSGNYIYGDVTTNGGTVTTSQASGTVDNNVPLTITPYVMPPYPPPTAMSSGNIPSPAQPSTSYATAPWYSYTSVSGLTVNGFTTTIGGASKPVETFVNIIVSGNLSDGPGLVFAKGVNARIYFKGNVTIKAKDYDNNNVDLGPVASSNATAPVLKYIPPPNPLSGAALTAYLAASTSYMPSDNYSRAAHVQFKGIGPTDGSTQTFAVAPPGYMHALIYAPSAVFSLTGNPDLFGAIVCASWSGNGNTTFHFDKELAERVNGIDYRVANYVEDVR